MKQKWQFSDVHFLIWNVYVVAWQWDYMNFFNISHLSILLCVNFSKSVDGSIR